MLPKDGKKPAEKKVLFNLISLFWNSLIYFNETYYYRKFDLSLVKLTKFDTFFLKFLFYNQDKSISKEISQNFLFPLNFDSRNLRLNNYYVNNCNNYMKLKNEDNCIVEMTLLKFK